MKLEYIDLSALPGIDPGFRIESLSPGVNFITGPNASGKSSLIRALRLLLEPARSSDALGIDLSARFSDGRQTWNVRRQGRIQRWVVDGQPAERPSLPESDALGCYLVTIEDLFRLESGSHRHLAEELRREIQQGYDLALLRQHHCAISPQSGRSERRRLQDAQSHLRDVVRRQRDVSDQQKRLPELGAQIEQARSAQSTSRDLEMAIRIVEGESELQALSAELSGFPNGMDRLHGQEISQLDELDRRLQANREQQQAQRLVLRDSDRRIERAALGEPVPDEEALDVQIESAITLAQTEQKLHETRETQSVADVRLREARQRLQIDDETDAPPELGAETLRAAQQLATEIEGKQERRRWLMQRIEDRPPSVSEDDIESRRLAAVALRDWLGRAPASAAAFRVTGTLAAAGAGLALGGGWTGPAWLAIVGAALVVVSILGLWQHMASGRTASRRASTSELQLQGISLPAEWTRAAVQRRLNELERDIAAMRVGLEQCKQQIEIEAERKRCDEELAQLEDRRRRLAREVGFDPTLTTRAMSQFLEDLKTFHDARLACAQAQTAVRRLQEQYQDRRTRLEDYLSNWRIIETGRETGAAALLASLRNLQRRSHEHRDAQQRRDRAEQQLEGLESEGREIERSRNALFETAGLETERRAELELRIDHLTSWREVRRKYESRRDQLDSARNELSAQPELLARVDADDLEGLKRDLAQARQHAQQLAELSEEQGRISARIEQAVRSNEREQAMAAVAIAEDQLAEKRHQRIESQLGQFLLDEIEGEHRRESEPPLLERAREVFQRFTHRQWSIEFDTAEAAGFSARDLALGERRTLDQLSTATRMQLMLALRVARIELREQSGPSLPMFIDEVLTTSDVDRACSIIQSLQALADDNDRQLIYLAASEQEVRLWAHATGRAPHTLRLGELRRRPSRATEPAFAPPEPPRLPEPESDTPGEYARRLDIPPLDPRDKAGRIHLFHLLHDEPERFRHLFMTWRIETLSGLESLLRSPAASEAIGDEHVRSRLEQRCRLTRDWVASWRIGRGRPVTTITLAEAHDRDIFSDANIEGVRQINAQVNGKPTALLEALQSPILWSNGQERRLMTRKLDAFRDYLIDEGYLEEREPLSAEQRRRRLIEQHSTAESVADLQTQIDWLESATVDAPTSTGNDYSVFSLRT